MRRFFGSCTRHCVLIALVVFVVSLAAPAVAQGAPPYLAGGPKSSFLIKRNGTLWSWGWNAYGQLGLGDKKRRTLPKQIASAAPWRRVACAEFHAAGVRTDGTLWAWGWNTYWQLGLGNIPPAYQLTPTQVGTDTDWSSVSCGTRHTLALRSGGRLWGWGSNYDGELGLGDTAPRFVPTQIGEPSDTWLAVAAGDRFSAAIRSDGSLWMWGHNHWGQLGQGDKLDRPLPRPIWSQTGWKRVALGQRHVLALKSNGTLWAWGSNSWGQLGLGDKKARLSPVRIGKRHDWAAIACGSFHSLALRKDGTIWAWGMNSAGEVGTGWGVAGVLGVVKAPRRVGSASGWLAIACGGHHSLALRTGSRLYVWGLNDEGQLGRGNRTDRYAPVRLYVSL